MTSRGGSSYGEAFGWRIDEMPELDYTIVVTGPADDTGMPSEPGCIGGGMMQRGEAAAPVVTIDVDDIDVALQKIESLGGRTVTPRSPVGRNGFRGLLPRSGRQSHGIVGDRSQLNGTRSSTGREQPAGQVVASAMSS